MKIEVLEYFWASIGFCFGLYWLLNYLFNTNVVILYTEKLIGIMVIVLIVFYLLTRRLKWMT